MNSKREALLIQSTAEVAQKVIETILDVILNDEKIHKAKSAAQASLIISMMVREAIDVMNNPSFLMPKIMRTFARNMQTLVEKEEITPEELEREGITIVKVQGGENLSEVLQKEIEKLKTMHEKPKGKPQ